MSNANLKSEGSLHNNFSWQKNVLVLLKLLIAKFTDGTGTVNIKSVQRTATLKRYSGAGNIAAGKKSVSFYNAGNVNATLLGEVLKPAEFVSYDGVLDTLGAFSFDATNTDLVITTIT